MGSLGKLDLGGIEDKIHFSLMSSDGSVVRLQYKVILSTCNRIIVC